MSTYEIRATDGTITSINATGYSWDKRTGCIVFYDTEGERIASYAKGTWVALNVSLPAIKADVVPSPAIKAQEFYELYGH